ncbi:MAG: NADH-quinone oxidoreductase subunit M, partial [Gammaproteobacteria bacterium]|nr:NADH-quinone oxidoreductase subunit M [Gammaproteobacteria bacterium]
MLADWPLLSLVVWLPIIGGIVVLLSGDKGDAEGTRRLALVFALITFLLSLGLYTGFDVSTADMQFVERFEWISTFNIFYHFGID